MTTTTSGGPLRLADITPEVLQDLAVRHGVCVRPVLSRLTDTTTGETSVVPIPCGSTQARKCPPCAERARRLRMQQCREGWHRDDELPTKDTDELDQADELDEQTDAEGNDSDADAGTGAESGRRVRSTRRRQDVPDLPRVPMQDHTVGRTFTAPNGRTYRPSMFLTLTLPSYGRVHRDGTPVDPETYDYHRAAMDALHFPKLVDRFWQNLRRCAGYKVQYFATVEAQHRLAPHLHAAVRGVIPRQVVRQVAAATYHQLWWPPCHRPVYLGGNLPVWDERSGRYVGPTTGEVLPTWDEAVDAMDADPAAKPAHVVKLGEQLDYQGIIASAEGQVGKAIGYLTKYLVKDISETYGGPDDITRAQLRHLANLHQHVRWLPCSPECCNWLRFGVQPKDAQPGMAPGECPAKAHDRHHLGTGGRRVLVSRQWTGKTLTEHRADRAEVVRATLAEAGVDMPEHDRCSATAVDADGAQRFVWSPVGRKDEDVPTYRRVMADAIAEKVRWRTEYEQAKQLARPPDDTRSATDTDPASSAA
jgi:Replication initiator protein, pSAM2